MIALQIILAIVAYIISICIVMVFFDRVLKINDSHDDDDEAALTYLFGVAFAPATIVLIIIISIIRGIYNFIDYITTKILDYVDESNKKQEKTEPNLKDSSSKWYKWSNVQAPSDGRDDLIIAIRTKHGGWEYQTCCYFGGDPGNNRNWGNKTIQGIPEYWSVINNPE